MNYNFQGCIVNLLLETNSFIIILSGTDIHFTQEEEF